MVINEVRTKLHTMVESVAKELVEAGETREMASWVALLTRLDQMQSEGTIDLDDAVILKRRCRKKDQALLLTFLAFDHQGNKKLAEELQETLRENRE